MAAIITPYVCTEHRLPMASFQWMESFDTGNAVIDGQRQELMECLSELAAIVGEGKAEKVHAKCLELRGLLDAHFVYEEDILREAAYPRLDDHLYSHRKTTARLSHVCTKCLEACKDNLAGPCIMDMTTILIHDFLHEDMDLKSFLQTKGLANNSH